MKPSLIDLKELIEVEIVSLSGGEFAVKRLKKLGLIPGIKIKLIKKISRKGPVLIKTSGKRIGLSKSLASKISVRVING